MVTDSNLAKVKKVANEIFAGCCCHCMPVIVINRL